MYYRISGSNCNKIYKSLRQKTGGPELNWYEVQPTLYSWEGDLLLVLDCCHAAQAARGRENRVIELLAASGVNRRTPPAGNYSFTSILITIMSRMLLEKDCISVTEIYDRLVRQIAADERVQETPVRLCLNGQGDSIVLKPKKALDRPETFCAERPLALLSLTISLSSKPDRLAVGRLQRWLKGAAPKSISSITVDKLLLRAQNIQTFLQQRNHPGLQAAVNLDLEETGSEVLTVHPLETEPNTHVRGRESEAYQAQKIVENLQAWTDLAYHSIQSNLFLNQAVSSNESLEELQSDKTAQVLGLSDSAKLRMLNTKYDSDPTTTESDEKALPKTYMQAGPTNDKFQKHGYGRASNVSVFIEYRNYNTKSERGVALQRVKRLSRLLRIATDPEFHIAAFAGYVDEPLDNRLGLVFQTPNGASKHITLFEACNKNKLLSLNTRYSIAIGIARAISSLHMVRWLHKSLSSEDVLFFANSSADVDFTTELLKNQYDLSRPFLFGFDISRPVDASSDGTKEYRTRRLFYTHPARWGCPTKLFSEVHDIYALGVILLEIGCWRTVEQLDKKNGKFEDILNEEGRLRKELISIAAEYLPHMAGEQYCQAVLACLGDDFDKYCSDGDALKLHKSFSTQVLDVLTRGVEGLKPLD